MKRLFILIAILGMSASVLAETIYSCGAPVLRGESAGLFAPVYSIVVMNHGLTGQAVVLNEIVGVATKAPYGRSLPMVPVQPFGPECSQYQTGQFIARFCLISGGRKDRSGQFEYKVQLMTSSGASAQCMK